MNRIALPREAQLIVNARKLLPQKGESCVKRAVLIRRVVRKPQLTEVAREVAGGGNPVASGTRSALINGQKLPDRLAVANHHFGITVGIGGRIVEIILGPRVEPDLIGTAAVFLACVEIGLINAAVIFGGEASRQQAVENSADPLLQPVNPPGEAAARLDQRRGRLKRVRHRRLGVGKKVAAVLNGSEKLLAAFFQRAALPNRRDKAPESLQLLLRKPDPGADFLERRIRGGIQLNRRIKIGLLLRQVLPQRGDFRLALLGADRFGIDGGNQPFKVGRKDILRQNRGVERVFQIAPRGFEIRTQGIKIGVLLFQLIGQARRAGEKLFLARPGGGLIVEQRKVDGFTIPDTRGPAGRILKIDPVGVVIEQAAHRADGTDVIGDLIGRGKAGRRKRDDKLGGQQNRQHRFFHNILLIWRGERSA